MGLRGRTAALRSAWWPRPGERLIPAVSAILLASSYPPLHPLLLPFVGLAPFALWVRGLPSDGAGRAAARRGGVVFGTIYFGIVFYWILVALIWFTKLAILAFVASIAILVVMTTVFAWLLHHGLHKLRVPMWVVLPVAWTAMEWSRAHLPSTIAFPWLGLGSSLTGFPELVGIAELIGSRGVTFWIALVNALVAGLVFQLQLRAAWTRHAAVLAVVVLAPMGWGVWRARTLETRPVARVAVVQPNIPEHIKLDPEAGRDSTIAALDRLMPLVEPGSVDLVVMPEVTLTLFPRASGLQPELERVQAYSREVGAPIVFGALGYTPLDDGSFVPFNSAFVMSPQGLEDFQYDKRYLVPIVERVPFLPSNLLGGLQYFGAYGVGEGWPLVRVDEIRFGVLICYESTYPAASRALRREGADVLLNITNDAWYGREPLYARTTALWQHPAHMVMRAIENRTGVARSANTGISLYVDPIGRVYDPSRLFEEDVRIQDVETTDVLTFYTRHGDLVGTGAALFALLLALTAFRAGPSLDPLDGLV
jgi:apolipoprotein N-acyltransferase